MEDKKLYYFKSQRDYTAFLYLLIELAYKHFDRFKKYLNELESYVKSEVNKIDGINIEDINDDYEKNETLLKCLSRYSVNYYQFKEIEDKINTTKYLLLNIFADRSRNAASYYRFRDEVKKKRYYEEINLPELNQEMKEIINELYHLRNYEHHMTDSKFIEWKNYRDNEQSDGGIYFEDWVNPNIDIKFFEEVSMIHLVNLYLHLNELKIYFGSILQIMKKDFSIIIGSSMQINRTNIKGVVSLSSSIISINGYQRHLGKKK